MLFFTRINIFATVKTLFIPNISIKMKKTESILRSTVLGFCAAIIALSCFTTTSCSMFGGDDGSGDSASIKEPKLIPITAVSDSDTVFICTGKASKRFHSSDTCEGIMQCTKEILPVTRAEAETRHRTFCHKCYRDSVE